MNIKILSCVFSDNGICKCTPVGRHRNSWPTVISLDLREVDQTAKEHNIVHEFGHALGLQHEHQRSDFWEHASKFIDMTKMASDVGEKYIEHYLCKNNLRGDPSYDADSVMHYW